jgi:RNA polymerase sigma-54 factor
LLDKDGITIARRTVAKYREQMRIPTAPLRKSQAGAG